MAFSNQKVHSALSLTHPISSEIFPALYDWIFEYPVFQRWSEESVDWQLFCVGEPGAGKTTLATVIAKHLRQQFQPVGYPVVTIFAKGETASNEAELFEDFLHAVYQGFGEWPILDEDRSQDAYQSYMQARFNQNEGSRINRRLSLLRKALHKRLEGRKTHFRAFLILDGLDLGSHAFNLLLETELATLRGMGINVLQTSRLAVFEQDVTRCDHAKHGDPDEDDEPIDEMDRERLDMFYNCESCLSVLCLPCKAAGRTCDRDTCTSKGPMRELYDHVNITISISTQDVRDYISWNIEREHGDLGLQSSARKPPLSALGLSIKNDKDPGLAHKIVSDIQRLADGHIGFCKARLDVFHELKTGKEWLKRQYQMPANIVSMLDAAVRAVQNQPTPQQRLGLLSIAASGRNYWPDGIEIPLLRQLLKECYEEDVRSGEDILRAARGLLHAPAGEEIQSIVAFSATFFEYVFSEYNEKIFQAGQELPPIPDEEESDEAPDTEERARFEPRTITEEPTEFTPSKLHRSVTTVDSGQEAAFPRYIVRQGTRAWT